MNYAEQQLKKYVIDDPTYPLPFEIECVHAKDYFADDESYVRVIMSGIVLEKQEDSIIQILGVNQFIGLGMLFQKTNSTQIMALTEVEIMKIRIADLTTKLRERAFGMELLIQVLNERIASLAERLDSTIPKEEQVWRTLCKLDNATNHFSKKMMANYLHMSIQQVNKSYNQLAAKDFIKESSSEMMLLKCY